MTHWLQSREQYPKRPDIHNEPTTNNLQQRLYRHNLGRVKSTKARLPWKLVYFEEHPNRSTAAKREYDIKACKRRSSIEELIKEA